MSRPIQATGCQRLGGSPTRRSSTTASASTVIYELTPNWRVSSSQLVDEREPDEQWPARQRVRERHRPEAADGLDRGGVQDAVRGGARDLDVAHPAGGLKPHVQLHRAPEPLPPRRERVDQALLNALAEVPEVRAVLGRGRAGAARARRGERDGRTGCASRPSVRIAARLRAASGTRARAGGVRALPQVDEDGARPVGGGPGQQQGDEPRVQDHRQHHAPEAQDHRWRSCQSAMARSSATRTARATTQPISLAGPPKRAAAPRPVAAITTASVDVPLAARPPAASRPASRSASPFTSVAVITAFTSAAGSGFASTTTMVLIVDAADVATGELPAATGLLSPTVTTASA